MATKEHKDERIKVEGLQASLQKFKDDLIGIPNQSDAVYYTQAEADAYNALLTGALDSTTPLTAEQAEAYNEAVIGASKEAGDTLSESEANAYNATLDGAISTSDVKTPAVPTKVKDYIDGHAALLAGYTVIDDWGTSEEHYDLNDLTTVGCYALADGERVGYFDNCPFRTTTAFRIEVSETPGNIYHRIYSRQTQYERYFSKSGGTWTAWETTKTYVRYLMQMTDYTGISDWGTAERHYDLNDITQYGSYACVTAESASYFDHLPSDVNNGFLLRVFRHTVGARRIQRLLPINSVKEYERLTANSGSTWTDWVLVQDDLEDYYTKDEGDGRFMRLSGYTSAGGTSSSAVDLNTITTPGTYYGNGSHYYIGNASVPSPVTAHFRLDVSVSRGSSAGNYLRQRIRGYNGQKVYERFTTDGGTTWNNFALVQDNFSEYLPLSGGTMTGNLTTFRQGRTIYSTTLTGSSINQNVGTIPGNIRIYTLEKNLSSVTFAGSKLDGEVFIVIFTAESAKTVAIANSSTYVCPGNANLSLSVPANGFVSVLFIYNGSKFFVQPLSGQTVQQGSLTQ